MPADLPSTVMLILVTAADTVIRLWPYLLGGVAAAVLLRRATGHWRWGRLPHVPRPVLTPLAVLLGAASPLPTAGMAVLVVQLRGRGLPAGPGLGFVLASSLMNPQLLILTLGALGPRFALVQLGAVLILSTALGLLFDPRQQEPKASGGQAAHDRTTAFPGPAPWPLAGHVAFSFLVGVTIGAALQVLLPRLGVLSWLGTHGWLSTPLLGWLGAPFYTCGGSAVPLARSLGQAGFGLGSLLTFLVVGPALRGSTLASLGCLMPRRAMAGCLALLALGSGLLGYALDLLTRRMG